MPREPNYLPLRDARKPLRRLANVGLAVGAAAGIWWIGNPIIRSDALRNRQYDTMEPAIKRVAPNLPAGRYERNEALDLMAEGGLAKGEIAALDSLGQTTGYFRAGGHPRNLLDVLGMAYRSELRENWLESRGGRPKIEIPESEVQLWVDKARYGVGDEHAAHTRALLDALNGPNFQSVLAKVAAAKKTEGMDLVWKLKAYNQQLAEDRTGPTPAGKPSSALQRARPAKYGQTEMLSAMAAKYHEPGQLKRAAVQGFRKGRFRLSRG